MSVNSSSPLNITQVPRPTHPLLITPVYFECHAFTSSHLIFTVFTYVSVFLLPLYVLILHMGFQRWRTQRSVAAGQSTSHSDFFTYHIVTVEILGVLGSVFSSLGMNINNRTVLVWGILVSCVTFPGQTLFHTLTCVERYLAVVHPITYMRLRETGGVRIRNVSIVCVWLLCFGWMGATKVYLPDFPVIALLSMLGISIIVISFCCLSVLRVLTHSGPGEVGGNKERVDQSKRRAFHVICAIMGVLLLRFAGLLVTFGFSFWPSIHLEDLCILMDSGLCLTVPSSLVLPLLFLHKAGKLPRCGRNTESR